MFSPYYLLAYSIQFDRLHRTDRAKQHCHLKLCSQGRVTIVFNSSKFVCVYFKRSTMVTVWRTIIKLDGNVTLALMLICTCIGGSFQAGYNLSVINYPASHIQRFINDTFEERWSISLEQDIITLLWTIIVSSYSLGGLFGALLAGPMSVLFGRKGALVVKNCFVFSSAVISGTSRVARSVEMIILTIIIHI